MKNILKLMALFAFLLCFISCDEDEKAEIPAFLQVHGRRYLDGYVLAVLQCTFGNVVEASSDIKEKKAS